MQPFALERYFAEHEFSTPFLLCCSDVETLSVRDLLSLEEGAEAGFGSLRLGYTESQGSPSLRSALAGLYDRVSPDQLLAVAGAEEGIYLVARALLSPGDHIVVHAPCYQSLTEVARAVGCEVTEWRAHEQSGWRLDVDELAALLRPDTVAVVVNAPHNPTGFTFDADSFEALVATLRERRILLVSDEVYRFLEYSDGERPDAAADLYDRAISLGVLSKAFGLAGLRIGWLACRSPELMARLAAYKDYTTICCSAPSEFLAEVALRNRDTILRRNRSIVAENLGHLDAFLTRHRDLVSWVRPGAGPVGFPCFHPPLRAAEVADSLRTRQGVLLLPGDCYGDYPHNFRIGFGRRDFPEALAGFEEFLSAQRR